MAVAPRSLTVTGAPEIRRALPERAYCACGRALYARRAIVGKCSSCQPRRARTCRDCGRDIGMFRRDFLCAGCRSADRTRKPVVKPGCFTPEEWDGVPGQMPSLREEYPRFSPCRDCTLDYQFSMAREGRCDLFLINDEGVKIQLISAETMKELMETDIEDPDD